MINLGIPAAYMSKWGLIKMIFGGKGTLIGKIPNVTFDPGESLIIHSPNGDATVAVKVNSEEDGGGLRVLFSVPAIDRNYIDVKGDELFADNIAQERIGKK